MHHAAVSLTVCVLCFRWTSKNQTLPGFCWLLVFPTRCTPGWALEAALVLAHQPCRELTSTRYVYTMIAHHICTIYFKCILSCSPLLCPFIFSDILRILFFFSSFESGCFFRHRLMLLLDSFLSLMLKNAICQSFLYNICSDVGKTVNI